MHSQEGGLATFRSGQLLEDPEVQFRRVRVAELRERRQRLVLTVHSQPLAGGVKLQFKMSKSSLGYSRDRRVLFRSGWQVQRHLDSAWMTLQQGAR